MLRATRFLFAASMALVVVVTTFAQARRLNPQDPLNIAVYCNGADISIYHIDANGQGQQALYVTQGQINGAVASAYTGGGAVTVGTGEYGVTLTALPGVRLRATQDFNGTYSYEFAGDACGPVNLTNVRPFNPQTAVSPAATSATVSGPSTPASTNTTGTIDYTVRRGDSFYRIARRFNITVDELAAANGTIPSDIIYAGQTLKVPNQVVEQAPAAGSPPASEPAAPQLTVDASGNYLQDPSFEGLYTGRGASNLNIPGPWGLQVINSPSNFEWQNLQPFAFPRRDPPIHGGNLSLNINRGYATFSVVLFQQVRVPANAQLEAGAWAWYDTCDAGRSACDNNGNPNFRVGIDPNGGTNPYEGDIVWSAYIAPQGFWQATSTATQAQGEVVTMYISASQERPRAINELYIDDAWLRQR